MEDKVHRVTKKQIDADVNIDPENVLYVKHGKKWTGEPAVIVSEEYLESRKGIDDDRKMQLFMAKSLIDNNFQELTRRERDVILLYIKGNTQQEVADLLDISRNTVNQYVKRARKKLKKSIPEFQKDVDDVI